MRWFFLFLLALNVFYYVWHQQQSPLRAKEIAPLELYKDGQKNILLLAESNLASRARSGSQVPAPSVPPAAEESIASESACLYLGGGGEEADARRLQQRLLGLDIEAEVEARGEMSVDYWVYLPPLASREAALRQLKELQARNIDSYLIGEGVLANGISLGMFSARDSAESAQARLKTAGYEAELKELPRGQRDFWVRVAPGSRRLVDEQLLQELARDFKGLQHQIMLCKGVASP
ncbi:SPOR domain-containing protein [Pseudomonas aeruginosa]|uniref:SPOR domain-containing protein n=1 Tax=Pseudomonas aeruginosa TaxID=287 RepID=UPI001068B5CA|nr:SPOR domain-containing protein [Pseudomonas aeruginosa]MCJ2358536.1 SPOR domain-containing protein [Pseudomonas aeruginosa]MCO2449746.1 SPOR domain-containing protein [Pseudomonas aeruginosa]MDF5937670.1 SPOR domain-containing protein [Pseudomonas aeruginosa]MDX4024955.1 SPOR domain-containing protein [Pseudomonas aeruginosa]TEG14453.1 SPOR domain-containing protein [Pseudomonas aeruginosa]